jgi:hypothetical protein
LGHPPAGGWPNLLMRTAHPFINTVKKRFLSSSAIGTFEHSVLMCIDAKAIFVILDLMLILYPLNIPD